MNTTTPAAAAAAAEDTIKLSTILCQIFV